ncbi:hypothetical protein [Nocardia sp. NBC_00511]|uniref:hypothetical protein n=1 Tax=Nocardia sp. NBC_00511 TaxID=2903591 RepID=UPI002F906A23
MNRGDVYRYEPVINRPGVSTLRLITSSNAINDADGLPVVLTRHILDTDPGGLLAVETAYGWVSAMHPEATIRRRLGERVGGLDRDTMERVENALRAAEDL